VGGELASPWSFFFAGWLKAQVLKSSRRTKATLPSENT
jgi:hypothetical protein